MRRQRLHAQSISVSMQQTLSSSQGGFTRATIRMQHTYSIDDDGSRDGILNRSTDELIALQV